MEEFRDVSNYEGIYQVSNYGNVKSLKRYDVRGNLVNEKILKQGDRDGYKYVELNKNRLAKKFNVHQLVAMAFLNHKPEGRLIVVNHKNFIRGDNRLENLEIVTQRENNNKKHLKSTSEYVGVYWCKHFKTWKAQIRINTKAKHLGSFKNEYDAHLAYQKALNQLTIK